MDNPKQAARKFVEHWTFRRGSEWLPIVVADGSTSISEVGYSGRGELAALSAEADGTAAPTVLTIPAIAGMELVSVKVGETDIAAFDFSVAQGEQDFSAAAFRLVGSAASGVTHTGALGANMAARDRKV